MTESQTLSRLVQAGRSVKWESREVDASWSKLDHAVRSGRKALPIAVTPLTFGLYPLVAKASVLALAVGTSAGATAWIYQATGEPAAPISTAAPAIAQPVSGTAARMPSKREAAQELTTEEQSKTDALEAPPQKPLSETTVQSSMTATAGASGRVETDSVGQELTLLRRAKQRLDRGDYSGSRSDLGEHARRFPSGMFADERRALQRIVDCSLGPAAPARARASRFVAAHPRSIHRAAVARACGLAPSSSATEQAAASSRAPTPPRSETPPVVSTRSQPTKSRLPPATVQTPSPAQRAARAPGQHQAGQKPAPSTSTPTNGPPTASFSTD